MQKSNLNFSYLKQNAMNALQGNWLIFFLCLFISMLAFMLLTPIEYLMSFAGFNVSLSAMDMVRVLIATAISDSLMYTFTAAMYSIILFPREKDNKFLLVFKRANRIFPSAVIPILLTKVLFAFLAFLMSPVVYNRIYDILLINIIDYNIFIIAMSVLDILVALISVYVAFAYILAPCVNAQMPDLNGFEVLRYSRFLMKGCKFKMFLFILSFVVWYILGAFVFGIGTLVVHAYMMTSILMFYREKHKEFISTKTNIAL